MPDRPNQDLVRHGHDILASQYIPWLLRIGFETGLEIVHDRKEGTPLRREDVDLPSFLVEPILGIENFLGLARAPREQQTLSTLESPSSKSGRRMGAHQLPNNLPRRLAGRNLVSEFQGDRCHC